MNKLEALCDLHQEFGERFKWLTHEFSEHERWTIRRSGEVIGCLSGMVAIQRAIVRAGGAAVFDPKDWETTSGLFCDPNPFHDVRVIAALESDVVTVKIVRDREDVRPGEVYEEMFYSALVGRPFALDEIQRGEADRFGTEAIFRRALDADGYLLSPDIPQRCRSAEEARRSFGKQMASLARGAG